MNLRDRFLRTVRGGVADRVPLVFEGFHYVRPEDAAKEQDPLKREFGRRLAEHVCGYVHCGTYANRHLMTPSHLWRQVDRREENGTVTTTTQLETPKGALTSIVGQNKSTRTTWRVKYPVESLEDIEKIRSMPWEPHPDLAPPDMSALPETFYDRCILRAGVSCPMVCVAGMMPYEYFLELCATHFDLMEELTALCMERTLATLDVVLAHQNIDYVWMGGSEWLTPPMGGPRLFAELVHKYEEPVIRRIHEGGAVSHVHCHGNVRSTIELAVQRGADFFEPVEPPPDGDITFEEAKQAVAGRMTLGGNLESRILENESADEVEAATRAAFEGGKYRMVLQVTAGPIGRMTPRMLENYNRMIDVWEELSPIDQPCRCTPPKPSLKE